MADWLHSFATLQVLNVVSYLWFTAVNVFAFSLSFGLRDPVGIDPPGQEKYSYGLGKETFLTPAPWIYAILLAAHLLFAGTLAFAQWTGRGRDIAVGGLSLRWPVLMVLSAFWTGTWVRQWYILSWVLALAVGALAMDTTSLLRRRYRLEYALDWKDELFVHLPFSLFFGWTRLIFAINTLAAFAAPSPTSTFAAKAGAVAFLALLSALAHLQAFSTRSGDIPMALTLALGQLAVFAHQIAREDTNSQHAVAWCALGAAGVSACALAKSVWGTVDVVRHGAGAVQLADDHDAEATGAEV